MIKKYHLITVPLKELFPKKKTNLLFLGKWCEIGNGLKYEIKKKIVDYPWSNHKKKERSYKKIFENYKFLKSFLSEYLNKIHKTNFSEKYWEQIFGNWLIIFLTVYQDKFEFIKNLKNYKIKSFSFINLNIKNYVPKDSKSSLNLFQDDRWNGFLISILIRYFHPKINYKIKNFKFDTREKVEKKLNFKSLLLKIFSKIIFKTKTEKYFIISSYLGFLNEIKFQKSINNSLNFNQKISINNSFKINTKLRNIKIKDFKNLSQKDFLKLLLIKFIPQSYLENYKEYKIFIEKKLNWEKNPQKIFTSNSHYYDDIFKIWLAEKRERKATLIIGQHGNGYIFPKFSSFFDRDVMCCDKFLFWGKKKFKNKKISQNFNLIMSGKNNFKRNKKNILMVQYYPYKYQNRIISTEHTLSDIEENMNLQKNFISGLKKDLKEKIIIRLGSPKIFSNDMYEYEKKQWLKFNNFSVFQNRYSPIKKSLKNSSFVVVNSLVSTVFAECLYYNIPCFVISNFNKNMFRTECYNDFLQLKKVGIIQNNSKEFSKLINKNYNNLEKWWNNRKIKKIIRNFNYNYNFKEVNPLEKLKSRIVFE